MTATPPTRRCTLSMAEMRRLRNRDSANVLAMRRLRRHSSPVSPTVVATEKGRLRGYKSTGILAPRAQEGRLRHHTSAEDLARMLPDADQDIEGEVGGPWRSNKSSFKLAWTVWLLVIILWSASSPHRDGPGKDADSDFDYDYADDYADDNADDYDYADSDYDYNYVYAMLRGS